MGDIKCASHSWNTKVQEQKIAVFLLFSKSFPTYFCVMTTVKVSREEFSVSPREPLQHILALCSSIVCIWRLQLRGCIHLFSVMRRDWYHFKIVENCTKDWSYKLKDEKKQVCEFWDIMVDIKWILIIFHEI